MGQRIIRFLDKENQVRWGCVNADESVGLLAIQPSTLCELVQQQKEWFLKVSKTYDSWKNLKLLAPVTSPCQVVCQGKNYLDHILETGVNPKDKDFNLLFLKASSSLAAAIGEACKPAKVELFDYELELALVIRKPIPQGTQIDSKNIFEFVSGLVMANDLSARDVQIPERQWFKGKSYRGFCPVGPWIWFWEADEVPLLKDLQLELSLNGAVRQRASTKQLIHSPEATLTEISGIFDLWSGDILLTGTPGGVAMKVKSKTFEEEFLQLRLSEKEKFSLFISGQKKSDRYLKVGDEIRSTIRSNDGKLDLGEQCLVVKGLTP